jgi:N-acyl-D-aspartate/D-glutamate deacylase
MPQFDIVIKNGTVIDGMRTPRYRADIGIVDGRIVTIGRITSSDGSEVLDATGLIVAPGFVDLHTHYDSQIYWDPWCTSSGWHGVTSVVIGNCGFGFAPCKPQDRDRAMLSLSRNEGVPLETMQAGMPWDWESFPEYLDSLDRTPKGVNVMAYMPLAPMYGFVMGGVDSAKERDTTTAELQEMCRLLLEGMEAGACGFSTQIRGERATQRDYDGTPMVTDTKSLKDLAALGRAMGTTGRGYFQLAGTMQASELVARESGRPVLYNVLIAKRDAVDQHGQPVPSVDDTIAWLERANADGLRIYAQAVVNRTPFGQFTLDNYTFFDFSTLWCEALLGDLDDVVRKLTDPHRRSQMKKEFDAGRFPPPLPDYRVDWVSSDAPRNLKKYEGLTIGEIAATEGKHPIDVMLDIACASRLKTGFSGQDQQELDPELMKKVLTCKYSLPGVSDGGAHTKFSTQSAFPTDSLTLWVREHGMMELEEMHWRLSGYPALVSGIRDRGYIIEGFPADIIVYDFDNLEALPPQRAYDFPASQWRLTNRAVGYRWTIVNGLITFVDGVPTGEVPGQLLRHGRAPTAS